MSEFADELIEARDLAADDLVGGAFEQAEKRRDDLQEAYPFTLDGGKLTFSDDPVHWAYGFCLVTALAGQFRTKMSRRLRACFEIFVRDALEAFFGEDTGGFRTGHPWDIYANKHFKRAKQVYDGLYEAVGDTLDWKWSPRDTYPEDPSYQREKDLGVDVVIWKQMPDTRGGRLYVLTQCATTENSLSQVGKCGDIKPRRLENYLVLPDAKFIRAIATPTCMLNAVEIRSVCREGGLLFDRSRLVKIVKSSAWDLRDRPSESDCRELFAEAVSTI